MSKSLDRIRATDPRVEDVEDNGPDECARYWVHLKSGWFSPVDETHCITGETIAEVRASLRCVVPCKCDDCREG